MSIPEDPWKEGSSFVNLGFHINDSKDGLSKAGITSGLVVLLDLGLFKPTLMNTVWSWSWAKGRGVPPGLSIISRVTGTGECGHPADSGWYVLCVRISFSLIYAAAKVDL